MAHASAVCSVTFYEHSCTPIFGSTAADHGLYEEGEVDEKHRSHPQ